MKKISCILMLIACLLMGGCRSSKGSKAVYAETSQPAGNHQKKPKEKEKDLPEPSAKIGKALAQEAKKWLGTPYRNGGHSRKGTDCSGMVMEVYEHVCDVKLPRSSREQRDYCQSVERRKAVKGDLVFFSSSKSSAAISHVGLYIGDGQMIHASSSQGVMVSPIDTGYWGLRFKGAGRVLAVANSKPSREEAPKKEAKTPGKTAPKEPTPSPKDITPTPPVAPKNTPEISLSDLLIEQKVDSICAAFMD